MAERRRGPSAPGRPCRVRAGARAFVVVLLATGAAVAPGFAASADPSKPAAAPAHPPRAAAAPAPPMPAGGPADDASKVSVSPTDPAPRAAPAPATRPKRVPPSTTDEASARAAGDSSGATEAAGEPGSGSSSDPSPPGATPPMPADPSLAGATPPTTADSIPPFRILGETVEPGTRISVTLKMGESFAGAPLLVPVTVMHGNLPGPVVCLVAGIHGDELNGVEIVRRTVASTTPDGLKGTLIGIPIANLHGLQRGSRYLPDRRDLNRFFPGHPTGSAASRIADVLFRRIVRRCDLLIDFHTGSLRRTNLPQLRADLRNAAVVDLAVRFGDMAVVNNTGRGGTLRRAATNIGIAAVTYEAGEPIHFDEPQIQRGVKKIRRLLTHLDRPTPADERSGLYWRTRWVRVDQGGILINRVQLGDDVDEGELLGTVTNPISSEVVEVRAPIEGRVIGMALNQVVIPGFAAYHLGLPSAPSQPPGEGSEPPPPASPPPEDDDAS